MSDECLKALEGAERCLLSIERNAPYILWALRHGDKTMYLAAKTAIASWKRNMSHARKLLNRAKGMKS